MTNMSSRIAEIIKDEELTLEQFATRLGVTKSAVSKWITGATKDLRNEHLFAIEDEYGVSARWIVTGAGPRRVAGVRECSPTYSPQTVAIAELVETLDPDGRTAVQDSAEKEKRYQEAREQLAKRSAKSA